MPSLGRAKAESPSKTTSTSPSRFSRKSVRSRCPRGPSGFLIAAQVYPWDSRSAICLYLHVGHVFGMFWIHVGSYSIHGAFKASVRTAFLWVRGPRSTQRYSYHQSLGCVVQFLPTLEWTKRQGVLQLVKCLSSNHKFLSNWISNLCSKRVTLVLYISQVSYRIPGHHSPI